MNSNRGINKLSNLVLVFLALCILQGCIPHTTGPTEVGVRVRKLALFHKKGVEDKVYQPGSTFFFLPFINDWYTFDTRLQNMEMTLDVKSGDRRERDDLLFKTIDGNDIGLDVIISFRIDPQKAPFILQHVAKSDRELKDKITRAVARSRTRDIFGELKTEEFYNAALRAQKAQEALDELNEILNRYGIIVERVSTKDYRFNPAYQKAIEDKKIADQLVEKNRSATRAAEEEYLMRVEEAQGKVNEMIAKADGEYKKAKIEADAYFEQQKLRAQAIEAEGIAEAQGIRAMNEALTGSGGEVMVKLRIAEALQGKRLILLPVSQSGMDLKTLDMNKLLETYGLMGMKGKSKPK